MPKLIDNHTESDAHKKLVSYMILGAMMERPENTCPSCKSVMRLNANYFTCSRCGYKKRATLR